MSKALGTELPQALQTLLSGNDLESHWGEAIPLATVDDQGLPHFAILSFGEVIATSATELRIGTYPNSGTTRNMQSRPGIGLLMVHGDGIYYIKGLAKHVPLESGGVARFDVAIQSVSVDSEPGARITSGLGFEISHGKEWWLATARKNLAALL